MAKPELKLVQDDKLKTKRNKQALDAPRDKPAFLMLPEDVMVMGVDEEDSTSPLNDERLNLPIDEHLVYSIMKYGVKKNINARKDRATGKVYVVDGRQRVLCAREANRRLVAKGESANTIPVRLENGDDDMMFEYQVILNYYVESTPLMKARTASKYMGRNRTEEETARLFGVSTQTINDWMTLLQMDPEVHAAVDAKKISCHQALKLSRLTKPKQVKAVKELVAMGPKPRRKRSRPEGEEGEKAPTKMPSKEALLNIVLNGEGTLDPNFILGLNYALGRVSPKEVAGLSEIRGPKK